MSLNESPGLNWAVMVVFSFYPADMRVQRAAEALGKDGYSVDVICLKGKNEPSRGKIHDVNIIRLPCKRSRGSKVRYIYEYGTFMLFAFLKLSFMHIRRNYKIIHIHNMPDILVLTAILPKLAGAKIILDLHDPSPEVYMAKYSLKSRNVFIKWLLFLERQSIRFSNLVITPNIAFRELFISRGCPANKIHIIMNAPDEDIFNSSNVGLIHEQPSDLKRVNLMYHGTLFERNGLDIALKAISILRDKIPGLIFHVYGEGEYLDKFLGLVKELRLEDLVKYHGYIPPIELPGEIRKCDLGIIPNRSTVFNEINMPTRIFEYLSMERAVIVPRTKGIRDYFDEESIYFHDPGNVTDLAGVIIKAINDHKDRSKKLDKGLSIYRSYRWEKQRSNYLQLIAKMMKKSSS